MSDKHKLQRSWSFWTSPRGRLSKFNNEQYEQNLTKIGDFDTVEGFFEHYCFLKRPSDIPVDNKLMMFKEGCKPMWEKYPNGGTWILQLKKREEEDMNNKWEQILLACIGEDFNENVIGIVLSKRMKRNLLELWITDRSNEEAKIHIGESLRVILGMNPDKLTFYFKDHNKSLKVNSTLKGIESYTFTQTPLETPLMTPQTPMGQLDQTKLSELKESNFRLEQ